MYNLRNRKKNNIFILYRHVAGIGQSLNVICGNVVIQQHFHSNRVLGSGLGMFGMSLGALTGPLLVHRLLQAYSLRGSLLIHSAICLQATVFASNYRPHKLQRVHHKNIERQTDKGACAELLGILKSAMDFRLLRVKGFALFCVGGSLSLLCLVVAISHIPGRAVTMGYDTAGAAYLLSTQSLGNTVLRVISTFAANQRRVHTLGYYAVGCALTGVGSICFAVSTTYGGMQASVAVLGAGFGK